MQDKYISDLQDIKDMMNRSSRFISLSGRSGIAVGTIAFIGAFLVHQFVYSELGELAFSQVKTSSTQMTYLIIIALGTLLLAVGAAVLFTTQEARQQNQGIWDLQTKRLVINLAIPLVTGGIICLLLLLHGFIALIAPLTLVFHGLALVNASQYTLKEIRSLGLWMILFGLLALVFIQYGLWIWVAGFGLLHIVYGILMQRKSKA